MELYAFYRLLKCWFKSQQGLFCGEGSGGVVTAGDKYRFPLVEGGRDSGREKGGG